MAGQSTPGIFPSLYPAHLSRKSTTIRPVTGSNQRCPRQLPEFISFPLLSGMLGLLLSVVTHIGSAVASINPGNQIDMASMNCDRPGYTPCWDLGHFAGNQTSLQIGCPGLSNGNKTQADDYCLGFKQRQTDLASQQQQNHVIK
ncbi:MAG: hypothetical protein DLM72_19060 [Candidatus Nitrosopolaris wilkensis]|nr:MAG: hypothetical protein DLM72_19060 [Candidatus Nitrosopolaris wilkensis]